MKRPGEISVCNSSKKCLANRYLEKKPQKQEDMTVFTNVPPPYWT